MGELHLEIYKERMLREYEVDVQMGNPKVAYRETLSKRVEFDYLHKKQTGGAGQFARVTGYIEPIPLDDDEEDLYHGKLYKSAGRIQLQFINDVVGGSIPPNFIPAVEKGFVEASQKGPLIGYPLERVRVVLNGGAFHAVDSSELAFRLCAQYAFREAISDARPIILEPIMKVEITVPVEFQSALTGSMLRRKATLNSIESVGGQYVVLDCEVALNQMMRFSTDLRSLTEGKGEFSMEYNRYEQVSADMQSKIVAEIERSKSKK